MQTALNKNKKILNMSLTLNAFRTKLLAKILNCRSQTEVKRFIEVAIKSMKRHLINGHIISRFVEKTMQELQQMSPMDHDAQQWSNINMARIEFKQWIKTSSPNT
jgi:hypothetical protein